jgi:hypothetical protein
MNPRYSFISPLPESTRIYVPPRDETGRVRLPSTSVGAKYRYTRGDTSAYTPLHREVYDAIQSSPTSQSSDSINGASTSFNLKLIPVFALLVWIMFRKK